MQRLREGEYGAITPLIAVMLVALLGMGALAIDAGALYQERRELQNGADAAVLAVAQDCAGGAVLGDCGDYNATAETYADENAEDDASDVDDATGVVIDFAQSKATVTATTIDDGTPSLAHWLAPVIGIDSTQVEASASAIWGPLQIGSVDTLPLTISRCEYEKYIANPANKFPADEPWTEVNNGPVQVVYFHGQALPCHDSNSGADMPGGFGWLDNTGSCEADIIDGWVGEDPGAAADQNACSPDYVRENILNKVIHLAVFDGTNDLNGNNGQYHVYTYAALYVTGYNFGGQYKETTNGYATCSGSDRCIAGWFTEKAIGDGTIGGPDTGVYTVQMTE